MSDSQIYLDTYVLQQDMRIRLPKCVLSNLGVKKGETLFDIYLDSKNHSLILHVSEANSKEGVEEDA